MLLMCITLRVINNSGMIHAFIKCGYLGKGAEDMQLNECRDLLMEIICSTPSLGDS